jgi:hypothetical protein
LSRPRKEIAGSSIARKRQKARLRNEEPHLVDFLTWPAPGLPISARRSGNGTAVVATRSGPPRAPSGPPADATRGPASEQTPGTTRWRPSPARRRRGSLCGEGSDRSGRVAFLTPPKGHPYRGRLRQILAREGPPSSLRPRRRWVAPPLPSSIRRTIPSGSGSAAHFRSQTGGSGACLPTRRQALGVPAWSRREEVERLPSFPRLVRLKSRVLPAADPAPNDPVWPAERARAEESWPTPGVGHKRPCGSALSWYARPCSARRPPLPGRRKRAVQVPNNRPDETP